LIVHRLLQSLPDLPPAERPAAARRFLALPLHELAPTARDEILAETLAVLEHPDFAPLFGPGSRAEVPILGVVEGAAGVEVVSGQVDRLLVGETAVSVVDFKTNRPAPLRETEVPLMYLRQMAAYRAVLKGIYPDKRIHSVLLWTEGPRIMQLSDDLVADHAP
jgi:ATP-dependent helicase/nuclease subunit A